MKFSCAKDIMERAITVAERFTGKNVGLPALAHILIDAKDSGVWLAATNLEYAIEWRLKAQVAKEGRAAVPARVLSSLVQSMGDGLLDVSGERGGVSVRGGLREGKINGIAPDDFPLIPKIKKTEAFLAEAHQLGEVLMRVIPASSVAEFKPELTGVLVRAQRSGLVLAATDTFRLAEASVPLVKTPVSQTVSCIVPHRVASEAARILDGEEGNASVSLGDNQMLMEAGSWKVTSRTIEGAFPEYRSIVPTDFTCSAHLKKNELLAAIRAASVFASKLQEVTVRFVKDRLEISASNPEVGEYRTSCPAARSGGEIAMSFNWRYLLDGAQALEEEDVFFGCNSETSPALLRNKSHQNFSYVVMPIRLT